MALVFSSGTLAEQSLDAEREEQRQLVQSVQEQVGATLSSREDANGVPQKIEKTFSAAPGLHGDAAVVDRFLKSFLNRARVLRNSYLQATDDLGWRNVLNADRIRQDSDLVETKEMLRKARELSVENGASFLALFDDLPKEARSLDISESNRADLESSFMAVMGAMRGHLEEAIDLRNRTVDEVGKLFAVLDRDKRAWSVENGAIMFERQADLDEFRQHFAEVQTLNARQDAQQQQGLNLFKALAETGQR